MKKKRERTSIFDAVQSMEKEDAQAAQQRRKTTAREQVNSQAALSQTKIFQSLVECRILLQRSLQSKNQQDESMDEEQCNQLLVELLRARQTLCRTDSEKNYEEILSNPEQLSQVLQSEYESQREEWKEVLDRRHQSIRLQSGGGSGTKFLGKHSSAVDASFWQQVESVVQHEKLRRQHQTSSQPFDDSKVYQQLLKDFVSQHASQHDQTAAQERLRQKHPSTKKNVDRRASKGRKVRYVVHSKLTNFTFPQNRTTQTMLDADEWFKSLFGGVGNRVS
jgi:hypothetical protein